MTTRIITALADTLNLSFHRRTEAALRHSPSATLAEAPQAAEWANDPSVKWVHPSNLVR